MKTRTKHHAQLMKLTLTRLLKAAKALQIVTVWILGVGLPMVGNGQTYTISFDTGTAAGWKVNGGGASGATPYVISISDISIGCLSVTSDGRVDGSFVPGGNIANFDGFWTATYSFYLPANATDVVFNYGTFFADDRTVIELNGNILNATGVPWYGLPGSMVFSQGGPLQAYAPFNGPNGSVSGSATSGFIVGGFNSIEAVVNNTYAGIYGPLVTLTGTDRTAFGLAGTISYSIVPEPSTLSLFGLAAAGLLICRRRR
jgi:hypothetical protein